MQPVTSALGDGDGANSVRNTEALQHFHKSQGLKTVSFISAIAWRADEVQLRRALLGLEARRRVRPLAPPPSSVASPLFDSPVELRIATGWILCH